MTLILATAEAQPVHYLPIATTLLSVVFFVVLLRRYLATRGGPHLLWWASGIFTYGLGTALEGAITVAGNTVALTKAWYIAGALLGGYPLAQGTVFLLLRRRTALILTGVTVPYILLAAALVLLSPVNIEALEAYRPSGSILGWQWLRLMTPFINGYAAVFLIGGAILSAVRYARKSDAGARAVGNGLIAFGAMLPAFGGGMAKAGLVEVLYVGEFVGLLFIWAGYAACVRSPRPPQAAEGLPAIAKTGLPPGVPIDGLPSHRK
ncbi:MAG: hypothetical protein O7E49_02000 [Gemmatimonadetes bacterium]|nr:hypothetical protein [Gemmatimonadota bacterium]